MADMDVDPPVQVKKEPKEGSEGKQRFEVKKVRSRLLVVFRQRIDMETNVPDHPVECSVSLGLG
jgi:hypothetical protein